MSNLDHIMELRAELASCILTRRERAEIERELKVALAIHAELELHHTAVFEKRDQAPPS